VDLGARLAPGRCPIGVAVPRESARVFAVLLISLRAAAILPIPSSLPIRAFRCGMRVPTASSPPPPPPQHAFRRERSRFSLNSPRSGAFYHASHALTLC